LRSYRKLIIKFGVRQARIRISQTRFGGYNRNG